GHSVYHRSDPRAETLRAALIAFSQDNGCDPILEVALELEHVVRESKQLTGTGRFPSIEFYAAVAFASLGFSSEIFPLIFAIARMGGWAAHWNEMMQSSNRQMIRPRQ